MKGVILAGGYGTRLRPMTKVTNKHLLPVYDKPMVYYPLERFLKAGINKILVITGPENAGDFLRLLGSGKDFNAEICYKVQDEAGGIAQAIGMAETFIGADKRFAVVLGDNIFEDNFAKQVRDFENSSNEAAVFLKPVDDPQRFGVAETDASGKVLNIVEKPKEPKSNLAVTGFYLYSSNVFDIIRTIKPSARGELEVTDINNEYIRRGTMTSSMLRGYWSDAGTIETLNKASQMVAKKQPE